MNPRTASETELSIRRWELNTIAIELIALVGAAVGIAAGVLPRFWLHVSRPALFAMAFFVLSCALLPLESVFLRVRYHRSIPLLKSLFWSALGSLICGAIVSWLSGKT